VAAPAQSHLAAVRLSQTSTSAHAVLAHWHRDMGRGGGSPPGGAESLDADGECRGACGSLPRGKEQAAAACGGHAYVGGDVAGGRRRGGEERRTAALGRLAPAIARRFREGISPSARARAARRP